MSKPHTPIWFDIDGTLVHTRVGKDAFREALEEVFGWKDDFKEVRFAGNTDLCVLMDFSEKYAGDREKVLSQSSVFFECMAVKLDEGLVNAKPDIIPGAPEFLAALSQHDHLGLYLLTGNARECAFHKLRHADLHHLFEEGGFGDDHADRNILAQQTRERVSRTFEHADQGWVIGDTPRDIQAAHTIGAQAIGIASGAYSEEELSAAGAALVVEDLRDVDALLEFLK